MCAHGIPIEFIRTSTCLESQTQGIQGYLIEERLMQTLQQQNMTCKAGKGCFFVVRCVYSVLDSPGKEHRLVVYSHFPRSRWKHKFLISHTLTCDTKVSHDFMQLFCETIGTLLSQ